ncbi:MAG: homogentisate phytyltransferase [Cyanobacteriota bacterium]|nr:homogentisate phytyltransferase [Cyanobacteriota bacterium]
MAEPSPSRAVAPPLTPLRLSRSPRAWFYALWKFWRPHTVIGTGLSVIGIAVMVVAMLPVRHLGPGLPVLLIALGACWLGNLYIVGLNQLEDIAIDRINKPHLPLAAGEFSLGQGRWIVALAGFGALGLATVGGPWLLATVVLSLAIGTAYSLPPCRLKRFPFWASFCILAVRGMVVNLGLFLHFSDRLQLPLTLPGQIWALTLFILGFSIAIAWFKDIPDIEGDRHYGISTLSVRLGQHQVFNLGRSLLTGCYLAMVLAAPALTQVNQPLLVISHLGLLGCLWVVSLRVNPPPETNRVPLSYPAFYQFIWKLFFLEYLLFPLACWLA